MQKDKTPRTLLESRLEAKKAEISDRVSLLQKEIMRNPVTEFARENPLIAVGAAALVGTLVGLIFSPHKRSASEGDLDALADRISNSIRGRLHHDPGSASLVEDADLRELVREHIPGALEEIRSESTRPSFLGTIFSTIGRHLIMEGTAYLLGQFSGRGGATAEAEGSE